MLPRTAGDNAAWQPFLVVDANLLGQLSSWDWVTLLKLVSVQLFLAVAASVCMDCKASAKSIQWFVCVLHCSCTEVMQEAVQRQAFSLPLGLL